MSLKKTVGLSALAWIVAISLLHAGLNLDLLRKEEKGERSFKVGFLPVTCHLTCPVNHYIQEHMSGAGGFVCTVSCTILASSAADNPCPRPARGASANASTPPSM